VEAAGRVSCTGGRSKAVVSAAGREGGGGWAHYVRKLIRDAPARRTETRRSRVIVVASRITVSSETHSWVHLRLAYIGDTRNQSASPIIRLI
jgi:hypothetical protein